MLSAIEFPHPYINNSIGKTKELRTDLRQRIINFDTLRSTVKSFIKFKQFGTTKNLPGRGRKPKLSLRIARKLCREVSINPRIVLKGITKSLYTIDTSMCTHTIPSSQTMLHSCLV